MQPTTNMNTAVPTPVLAPTVVAPTPSPVERTRAPHARKSIPPTNLRPKTESPTESPTMNVITGTPTVAADIVKTRAPVVRKSIPGANDDGKSSSSGGYVWNGGGFYYHDD
jgi:hypothetical protein